jgi:hypothetical protein
MLLRRLGVFVGGWTLEAACAACEGDGLAEEAIGDVLGRLVTRSLVVAEHGELSVRYGCWRRCAPTRSAGWMKPARHGRSAVGTPAS